MQNKDLLNSGAKLLLYKMNPSPADKTDKSSKPYKQRFKGVETFLRRVAFNLGNSPSQTEVKIISCIPIDVTDLQNKIINLERQLNEAKNPKSAKNTPVHTALIQPHIRNKNTLLSGKCSEVKVLGESNVCIMGSQCGDGSSKQRKSTVSLLFPSMSTSGLHQNQAFQKNENWPLQPNTGGHHKNFFKRNKKKKPVKDKVKPNTQMVYYTYTENSLFNNGMCTDTAFQNHPETNIDVDHGFSQSYLENVFERHFDPERVVDEFSDTSQFTSPICRDFLNSGYCPYESDVCSCCHGQFQNIDKYIGKNQNFIIDPVTAHVHNQFNKEIYYDSNLYDVVPVKEKNLKVTKEEKISKREIKRPVDTRCWPDNSKSYAHKYPEEYYHLKLHPKFKKHRRPTYRLQDTKDNERRKSPKFAKQNKADKSIGQTDTSKTCSIDCGEIYQKPVQKIEKQELIRPIFRQNAACLAIDVGTNNLAITRSIQIDINSVENKTEETLNQIKSILKSVLQEVKTNPQVNHISEVKSKKDAMIQNGPSQSNLQACSSLMHSFTYNNSSNANPYVITCNRQIPSHMCYTNDPYQRLKCTQNFPLLIHSPGRQMCGCCYKKIDSINRNIPKPAASIATNTEIDNRETRSKETDNLIKEIYKSMALTMDFPKETSNSEYDDLKSVTNESTNKSDLKPLRSTIVAVSGIQKRDKQIEALMNPPSVTTTMSKYNTSSVATGSDAKEVKTYLEYESQSLDSDIVEVEDPRNRPMAIASTISEHDSEDSTTGDDAEVFERREDVKIKAEKKGLLQRMLGSVKLFNRKKQNKPVGNAKEYIDPEDDEKSDSDSDEYQTIYSEKTNTTRRPKRHQYKLRNHATHRPVQSTRRSRESPYMEQEYRRQWDENLIFKENRGRRYSSERPYSYQQTPVYWQNYEARSALVDHGHAYNQEYNNPIKTGRHKVEQQTSPDNLLGDNAESKNAKSKISWLKKHKLGIANCGEQWKKFVLEN